MTFREYIDDLAKQGFIDGLRADAIIELHNSECANPCLPIRQKITPILEQAWSKRNENADLAELADNIDDAVSELEDTLQTQGGAK